jgi:hypothetical protein
MIPTPAAMHKSGGFQAAPSLTRWLSAAQLRVHSGTESIIYRKTGEEQGNRLEDFYN